MGFLVKAMRAGRLGAVVCDVVRAAGAIFLVAMVVPFLVGVVPAVDSVVGALVTFGMIKNKLTDLQIYSCNQCWEKRVTK